MNEFENDNNKHEKSVEAEQKTPLVEPEKNPQPGNNTQSVELPASAGPAPAGDETGRLPMSPKLPGTTKPYTAKLPDPGDDAELEQEIEASLGDMSLIDLYGMKEDISPEKEAESVTMPGASGADASQPSAGQQQGDEAKPIPAGIHRGKVINQSKDGVFVDLGGKSQGFLPSDELEEDEKLDAGAEIDVAIIKYESRDGLLILSRKTAEQQLLRRDLREGVQVEARVTGSNKGGLEMDIKGLEAFMPASQIDTARVEDFDSFINQRLICEVIQVERGDKNIVLSRRNVLAREEFARREDLWGKLEVGQLRHGVVRSLMDYGAFVDLGGMDGLLHISELSWSRVKHPKDILEVGAGVDVVIIGKDDEKKRLSLSLRKAGGDPWTTVEQKYSIGERHQAQITKLMDFGAFAELEAGVEGLIPIGEMSWAGRIRHPSDLMQPGMMVEVEVLNLDVEKRRISLSIKSLQQNPWSEIGEKYAKDQICVGKVARLTDFGAFVTLEPGIDGLIHISELSDKRVNKTSDVLSGDQEVRVRILSVDSENRRISLSMKNIDDVEIDASDTESKADEPSPAKKKRKRNLRGGLTW